MIFDIIIFTFWLICGIVNLASRGKISRLSYACVWALLMMYLLLDVLFNFMGR
jgi:hypothetical protein